MKRLVFAALLVLAISAFAVMPAFAAEACDHDMTAHQPTVAALVDHLNMAKEMGHLQPTIMPALLAPLNTAAVESMPVASRVGALQAFIRLVNAQAGRGIDAGCATHLVEQAGHVIMSLDGQM